MRFTFLFLLCTVVGLAYAQDMAPTYYVATNGNNDWSGTLAAPNAQGSDGPLASLEQARYLLRNSGMTKQTGATVLVRGGTYQLQRLFNLEPQDSGSAGHPVIYKNFPGETPVLSGGKALPSKWQKESAGHVYTLKIADDTVVKDLFVNGQKMPCSRFPSAGFLWASGVNDSKSVCAYQKGDIQNWPDSEQGVLVIRPYEWIDAHVQIKSIDTAQQQITLAENAPYPLASADALTPYFIENLRAGLNQPGEWCYNETEKTVYFWPPAGTDPNQAELIVGNLPVMVSLEGNADEDKWIEYIQVQGLTLKYAGREKTYRFYQGCALRLSKGVRDCSVTDCRFEDVNGAGIVLWQACLRNTIADNEFTRTGDTAIKVLDYLDKNVKSQSDHNTITNNYIHNCGIIQKSCAGIEIVYSANNLIAHNLIHDMPYNGIHMTGVRTQDWSSKQVPAVKPPYTAEKFKPYVRTSGNIIENNEIYNVMQELFDGGAIYLWGTMGSEPNIIRNNVIHHIGIGRRGAIGLYLDDQTNDTVFENNIVYGATMGMHLHNAPNNTIKNNMFAYCVKADISIQPEAEGEPPLHSTFNHNMMVYGGGYLYENGDGWNPHWGKEPIKEMDHNLFWRDGYKVAFGQNKLKGFDQHSLCVDPAFVTQKPGVYVLQPGAAATKLGIKPIDYSSVGLSKPLAWMKSLPAKQQIHFPLSAAQLQTIPGWIPVPASAHALRSAMAPQLDGNIAATEWPTFKDAVIRLQTDGAKPAQQSLAATAQVHYDDKMLYIALQAVQPAEQTAGKATPLKTVLCTLKKTDGSFIGLQGDAAGKLVLGVMSEHGLEHPQPATQAHYAVKQSGSVWSAEFAIPFTLLGVATDAARPFTELGFNLQLNVADTNMASWVSPAANAQATQPAVGMISLYPELFSESPELLSNVDFNTDKKGWDSSWWTPNKEAKPQQTKPDCTWVAEGVDGTGCLKISAPVSAQMTMQSRQGSLIQQLEIPGPGVYVLSYDLRAEDVLPSGSQKDGSFTAYAHVYGKDGSNGDNLGASQQIVRHGSFGWTRFEKIIRAPANTAKLGITFQLQRATGSVWIDNVSFRKAGAE